jgi:ParB-like chromosome segregation protein Spo0J
MKVQSVFIDEIKIGIRRREDYGDIDALADSISQFGLIQPIVVDADLNLIAGGRRVKAFQKLGRDEIDARFYSELSEDERRELELEENIRRKDLSAYERSRVLVELVETAERITAKEGEVFSAVEKTKKGGRPATAGNLAKTSERINTPVTTIHRAKEHVAAVEKFPEIAIIPTQKDALTVAKNLEKLPEPEQKEARKALAENDQDVLADLAEKPRLVRPKKTPGEKWGKVAYEILKMFNSIHSLGGVVELTQSWSAQERKAYLAQVREMIDELRQIETALNGVKHDRQAKRKVA